MKTPTGQLVPDRFRAAVLSSFLFPTALLAAGMATPVAKPNIVILLGDDVGYGDFGCYGAKAVKTPHVDRVAREGLRFASAYCSSSTCTPSRYSLLTGEYAFRNRNANVLQGDAALIIDPGRPTLPSLVRQAGYRTGIIGKWHLGLGLRQGEQDWNGEIKPGPLEVGFDYSFIMAATGDRAPCVYIENHRVVGLLPSDPLRVSYECPFPGENLATGMAVRASLKMIATSGHDQALVNGIGRYGYMMGGQAAWWKDEEMADVFTKGALDFIEREKKGPFFLYFATHDIHVPRVPNARFVGQTTMGPRGDAIVQFDDCVGRILDRLDALGLATNTLVILSSDNGPVLNDGYKDYSVQKVGDHKPAGPFRSGKYSSFEGGTRIPFIVRWPGRVAPGVSDALISQVDLTVTLAKLVGQMPAPEAIPDSFDMLSVLLGDSRTGRTAVVEYAERPSLRAGNWKYIPPGPGVDGLGPFKKMNIPEPGFLYDLATDPGETHDLSSQFPDTVKELASRLAFIVRP